MQLDHPPSALAQQIFEDITAHNRQAASYLTLGRQQFARDVMAWIQQTGVHTFGAVPIGELIELCRKEAERA